VKDLSSYKKGFEALTKQLQSKVGNAKRELKVLNQYEEMKKVIDNQILDQEKTYTEKQSVMEKQIELNKKSINRYMWLIEGKEQELEKEEKLARLMMKNEAEIERRLLSAMQNAKEFEEQSKGGRSAIANTLKKISEYKRLSEKSKVYIVEQKRDVTLLLEESQKYARNIADIKKKFLGKFSAMGKSEKSSITAAEVKKITASFNRLFNKKEAAEKLVNQLNIIIVHQYLNIPKPKAFLDEVCPE